MVWVRAMAKRAKKSKARRIRPGAFVLRWAFRGVLAAAALIVAGVFAYKLIDPPTTPYILSESRRLGGIQRQWVDFDSIAPVMVRSVVAAEDANFCLHWGFDMAAIRAALDEGGGRGASTISQQVVKNVYLWQGRSWPRKALEALITPVTEALWSKRRVLEVYLNVVEFGEGVFGVEAAAQRYFGVSAARLTPAQAARLAAVLPNPRRRSAANPSAGLRKRAISIHDGAATIRADGRAACFES